MQLVSQSEYMPASMVTPPLVNNMYYKQVQHPRVIIPSVLQQPGCVLPPNKDCYASPPMQATYPQQILISSTSVEKAATVLNVDGPVIANNYEESRQNTTNCVQHTVATSSKSVISAPAQPVVQNGLKSTTSTSPSPPKSWASLFASKNSSPQQNGFQNASEANANKDKPFLEKQDTSNVFPINHTAEFIDPARYRMGEFLSTFVANGKATVLQPRGLINPSNYCYLNAVLQAVIACPPFCILLCGLAQIMSTLNTNTTPVIDGLCRFVTDFKLAPANQELTETKSGAKKNKKRVLNTNRPIEPTSVHKILSALKSDLRAGRQEDAEEFLGALLNSLNDEMEEMIKIVNKKNMSSVMGPTTPIRDIFGGFLKSKVHRAGEDVTENIQPFFTIQLDLKRVKTVGEAFGAFFSKSTLEGETSYQQLFIETLPVILILHLKCFDFNNWYGCSKVMKTLEYPVDLTIEENLLSSPKRQKQQENKYKLCGVVYHDGYEATKGHYITDAYHVGYSSWFRYDDSSVKMIPREELLKPQAGRVPYLLFYRRCDTLK